MHRVCLFANGWEGCHKGLRPLTTFNNEDNMTTEIQSIITTTKTNEINSKLPSRLPIEQMSKMATQLEERKGNANKPLSLRPNRSVKKNLSLKPLGLRSR